MSNHSLRHLLHHYNQ